MSGFLIACFTPSNVCELCNFAHVHNAKLVRRAAASYIVLNIKEVKETTPKWKNIVDRQVARYVKKHLHLRENP